MGSCFSSESSEPGDDSAQNLLNSDLDDEEEASRIVDRNSVPHTTINLPSPSSQPRPITFDDIPSPTEDKPNLLSAVQTQGGLELMDALKEAFKWKDIYQQPTLDFSYNTNLLFTKCENHFSFLSAQNTPASKRECDALIQELLSLREHWGTQLLPLTMRNAFVRERISIKVGENERQFRIDCIQFFQPIVFYGNVPGKQEDLVKLYVFVVTDTDNDEVVIRYYLERSFLFDFYHVLCYFKGNSRGQLKPYGTRCPSYWEMREHMYQNAISHLKSLVSDSTLSGLQPIAASFFPTPRNTGPINI